jgi:hypothetical protein
MSVVIKRFGEKALICLIGIVLSAFFSEVLFPERASFLGYVGTARAASEEKEPAWLTAPLKVPDEKHISDLVFELDRAFRAAPPEERDALRESLLFIGYAKYRFTETPEKPVDFTTLRRNDLSAAGVLVLYRIGTAGKRLTLKHMIAAEKEIAKKHPTWRGDFQTQFPRERK